MVKLVLTAFAFSSLLFLFLIFIFILIEGLPLFYRVGVSNIIFGIQVGADKRLVRHIPHDRLFVSGNHRRAAHRRRRWAWPALPTWPNMPVKQKKCSSSRRSSCWRAFRRLYTASSALSTLFRWSGYIFGGSGFSLLATSIVLGIMILPTVISISYDSLMSVPRPYREGSLAMGATKWQTTYRVVIPAAKSGILASFILGMGRAIGETMAVIMVAGNALKIPSERS
ncbi:MAG: ABC transporter permease subunit [Desulfomicrobium escambiense]|nr:ABC transporter permease subunit [Desulfomicrobium escambiense]